MEERKKEGREMAGKERGEGRWKGDGRGQGRVIGRRRGNGGEKERRKMERGITGRREEGVMMRGIGRREILVEKEEEDRKEMGGNKGSRGVKPTW